MSGGGSTQDEGAGARAGALSARMHTEAASDTEAEMCMKQPSKPRSYEHIQRENSRCGDPDMEGGLVSPNQVLGRPRERQGRRRGKD